MYKNKFIGLLYASPYVIGLLVFTAFPFLASLFLSFTEFNIIDSPEWNNFQNYKNAFTRDATFKKSMSVTLLYVLFTIPLKLSFALFIAFILNFNLKGINLFRTAYYIPSILGGSVAIAVLWRTLFSIDGIVNQLLDVFGIPSVNWLGEPGTALFVITILRVWQFGSAMVIFLAALQGIPKDLYEAAAIEGASKFKVFFQITFPLITPVVFFNFIMQTAQAFQEFNGPYIITGGAPLKSTYLFSLYIYETSFKFFDMGYGSTLAWLLFTIIASFTAISFFSSKYWVFYADEKK